MLGIGNAERGDDAVGRAVVRLLRGSLPDDVELAELEGEAVELLDRFADVEVAFVVDACCTRGRAGGVNRLDVNATPLQQGRFSLSSHGLGLAEAVELARALGKLPPYCVVYAIEGASFEIGAQLSRPVEAAAVEVAARLRIEITEAGTAAKQAPSKRSV